MPNCTDPPCAFSLSRPPPLPCTPQSPRLRSCSAPVSPVTPPWTPPRRRRFASAEAATTWLDVQLVVDVVKDADGCRELHCYLHLWHATWAVRCSLRRLLFWMALFLALLPASAFRMMPHMPGMAFQAPTMSSSVLSIPARLSRLDNVTTLDHFSLSATAGSGAASVLGEEAIEGLSEDLLEEFDQCIVDASSEDDFNACVHQIHDSSLDELSVAIVREGCELLSSHDDGTVVGLLGQVLHTVKSEGTEALDTVSLRRIALRACVTASLHKVTVCTLPAVSACMLHAPDMLHTLVSLTT